MTPTIRKILLPTDFGPSAERTAASAAALAKDLGASLHLLHVMERPPSRRFPGPARIQRRYASGVYHEGRARLAALAAESLRQATDRITLEVRTGTPAEAIVDAAVDYGADLIVMSAPARSGMPKSDYWQRRRARARGRAVPSRRYQAVRGGVGARREQVA